MRDWLDEKHYLHDLISTDRRNPTVNGYGAVYGATEYSVDLVPILDPVKNVATTFAVPVRDANTPVAASGGFAGSPTPVAPSPYWADERCCGHSKANMHNPMMDRQGRVWFTAAIRGRDNPDFCKKGSDHPSAKLFPLNNSGRQLSVLDPKTQQIHASSTPASELIICNSPPTRTTRYGPAAAARCVGWLNTKMFDETGDAAKAQGWTP